MKAQKAHKKLMKAQKTHKKLMKAHKSFEKLLFWGESKLIHGIYCNFTSNIRKIQNLTLKAP